MVLQLHAARDTFGTQLFQIRVFQQMLGKVTRFGRYLFIDIKKVVEISVGTFKLASGLPMVNLNWSP